MGKILTLFLCFMALLMGCSDSAYTCYVLVNRSLVTWDELQQRMLSSQSGDFIDDFGVYSDLVFP